MNTASLWFLEISRYVARLGGIGLIGVGILDGSLLPLPGSQDFFTILLAARHRDRWLYYAAMSTIGSVIGGYLTYRLGLKGGEQALEKRLSANKIERISSSFERWGFMSLFVPALMPPPIPLTPFVLGAGALQYPLKKFLAALAAARFIRFAVAAYLASIYGRRVFGLLTRNSKLFIVLGLSLAGAGVLVFVALHVRRRWRNRVARAQG